MSLEVEFHTELQQRAREFAELSAWAVTTELQLPNGRIADVIFIKPSREIVIIEVKTVLKDSIMRDAMEKYSQYCHKLYLAGPVAEVEKISMISHVLGWGSRTDDLGLLAIGDRSVTIVRNPKFHKLSIQTVEYMQYKIDTKTGKTNKYYTTPGGLPENGYVEAK